jgi:hypothetical protein
LLKEPVEHIARQGGKWVELAMTPPAVIAVQRRPDKAFVYAALVVAAGILATTLPQTQVLARLPLQNLLKNEGNAGACIYR